MKRFRITFTYDDIFDVDALWPDGDAPDVVDLDAVCTLIDELDGAEAACMELMHAVSPTYSVEMFDV